MKEKKQFKFLSSEYDETTSTVNLRYGFNDNLNFEECFIFHEAPPLTSVEQKEALNICIRHLHLAAGVSYYKAFAPSDIHIENNNLSSNEAKFFEKFYVKGLGEFAYKNNLDLHNKIHFPIGSQTAPEASNWPLQKRTVIPVGGGKDSIVTLEALKQAGEDIILFSLGHASPIQKTIQVAGLPSIHVARKMSPNLFELNRAGALNGHVPVTGILSFVITVAAVLYGFNVIAMSNEHSANEGNMVINGVEINHQYSKSFEFEKDFANHVSSYMLKNLNYFSFLRPLSEIAIASLFAKLEQYHGVFTSCNKAFSICEQNRNTGWCCDCPKCRFVFLALAPFIEKSKLIKIFGKNLLDDASQEAGYQELLGLQGFKPFECVGEIKESLVAFRELNANPLWQNDYLVKKLAAEVTQYSVELDNMDAFLLTYSDHHALSKHYRNILDAFSRTR
jgi:7-cyano-7-deazaguanine synthase in queuosine biosynthesis